MGVLTVVMMATGALWLRPHWSNAALVVAALVHPGMALLVVAALAVMSRLRDDTGITPDQEAAMLRNLSSELDGGASVRGALLRTFQDSGDRLARAIRLGYPGPVIASELEGMLPLNGRRAAVAIAVGSASGASLGRAVGLLATRATDRGRLLRERRALTAQARATAWLIAGFPAAVVAFAWVSGRLTDSAVLPVVGVGLGLQAAGIGIVFAMLRRGA